MRKFLLLSFFFAASSFYFSLQANTDCAKETSHPRVFPPTCGVDFPVDELFCATCNISKTLDNRQRRLLQRRNKKVQEFTFFTELADKIKRASVIEDYLSSDIFNLIDNTPYEAAINEASENCSMKKINERVHKALMRSKCARRRLRASLRRLELSQKAYCQEKSYRETIRFCEEDFITGTKIALKKTRKLKDDDRPIRLLVGAMQMSQKHIAIDAKISEDNTTLIEFLSRDQKGTKEVLLNKATSDSLDIDLMREFLRIYQQWRDDETKDSKSGQDAGKRMSSIAAQIPILSLLIEDYFVASDLRELAFPEIIKTIEDDKRLEGDDIVDKLVKKLEEGLGKSLKACEDLELSVKALCEQDAKDRNGGVCAFSANDLSTREGMEQVFKHLSFVEKEKNHSSLKGVIDTLSCALIGKDNAEQSSELDAICSSSPRSDENLASNLIEQGKRTRAHQVTAPVAEEKPTKLTVTSKADFKKRRQAAPNRDLRGALARLSETRASMKEIVQAPAKPEDSASSELGPVGSLPRTPRPNNSQEETNRMAPIERLAAREQGSKLGTSRDFQYASPLSRVSAEEKKEIGEANRAWSKAKRAEEKVSSALREEKEKEKERETNEVKKEDEDEKIRALRSELEEQKRERKKQESAITELKEKLEAKYAPSARRASSPPSTKGLAPSRFAPGSGAAASLPEASISASGAAPSPLVAGGDGKVNPGSPADSPGARVSDSTAISADPRITLLSADQLSPPEETKERLKRAYVDTANRYDVDTKEVDVLFELFQDSERVVTLENGEKAVYVKKEDGLYTKYVQLTDDEGGSEQGRNVIGFKKYLVREAGSSETLGRSLLENDIKEYPENLRGVHELSDDSLAGLSYYHLLKVTGTPDTL